MSLQGVLSILTFALTLVILVLGLSGKFVPADMVASNAGSQPVAVAPTPTPDAAPTPAPAPAPTQIDVAKFEEFYDSKFVQGNEDAPVTIIEFSDFECPFCARFNSSWATDQIKETYGDDVNMIFAHFPLSFHPLAPKAGEATECAGELGGSDAYYDFKDGVFQKWGKPTRDVLDTVASEIGLDADAFATCLDEGRYATKVQQDMAFGRALGVTGTPGSIVVNNETGDYQKVSGAVPATSFDAPITQYLN